jgi:CubicO group peptidase (beta-lactamase class C family)
MSASPNRSSPLVGIVAALLLVSPAVIHGQLPSPAADAAEELLEIVLAGDEPRLGSFLETGFVPDFVEFLPIEEHLAIFASLRRDLEGREVDGIELEGPFEVRLTFAGRGSPFELRLAVEEAPPHQIQYVGWGPAGPEIAARSPGDLGAELQRFADEDAFSGVVLAATLDGVRFHEAYGLADRTTGRAVLPDTRFDLGSIGKLFTATAVLRLVQEGRLDLADPVGQYLEGFTPEVAGVSVEQLLRHRSGLGDYLSHPEFETDPNRFTQTADFLPLARKQSPAFEPGTATRYSNLGFVMLGAIVEAVTGQGYHEAIHDLVFRPAEMRTAGPAGGPEAARRYHRMPGEWMRVDDQYPEYGTPAGGSFAAAADLVHFVDALLDHRLLNERNTALLLNDFDPAAADRGIPAQFEFAGGADGVNAALLVRPAERETIVVLSNTEPFPLERVARRIQSLL